MTRKVSDIVDGLRNTYSASNTGEVANEVRALVAHIDAQAAEIQRLNQILANSVRGCCRSAASGPHKMGCDAQRARQQLAGRSNG